MKLVSGSNDAFIASIHRVMRPGGIFIVRDHDVRDEYMGHMAALAHTVFNAGLGTAWAVNEAELRHFRSADAWVAKLDAATEFAFDTETDALDAMQANLVGLSFSPEPGHGFAPAAHTNLGWAF